MDINSKVVVKNGYYIVLIDDVKKNAKIHPHMAAIADDILEIVQKRNEETDAPEHDKMAAWDIAFDDTGMPVMAVPAVIRGHETIGYLSPFRAYRFQVSGNFKGEGDFGSTPVMNLKKYADAEDDRVLCSLAELAIYKGGCDHLTSKELAKVDTFVALCMSFLTQLSDEAVRVD